MLHENFRAATIEGEIVLTADDGRTCTITINELRLDPTVESPVWYAEYTPEYAGRGLLQGCVANPLTQLDAHLTLAARQDVDPLFQMTFRSAPEEA